MGQASQFGYQRGFGLALGPVPRFARACFRVPRCAKGPASLWWLRGRCIVPPNRGSAFALALPCLAAVEDRVDKTINGEASMQPNLPAQATIGWLPLVEIDTIDAAESSSTTCATCVQPQLASTVSKTAFATSIDCQGR